MDTIALIDKLEKESRLSKEEWISLINNRSDDTAQYLFKRAYSVREKYYKNHVYIRGLIEISNKCQNDCYYCGIRRSNTKASRYTLSKEEILSCCAEGYKLGFRTFVLQGGEAPASPLYEEWIGDIIGDINYNYPDCAVTLSLGEFPKDTYEYWYDCGADRYLLRHETANKEHYQKLHPDDLSFESRMECLYDLKDIGYQVGCGFMVGSPFQTPKYLADDMIFLSEFQPDMVGIGPFIPHKDTPFADFPAGTLDMTLYMLALIRLTLPKVLLPATTALGTIAEDGREQGMLAGANVCMPNLSPLSVRKKYMLYDNKISTGDESAQNLKHLKQSMKNAGFKIVVSRGDPAGYDEV